MIWTVTTSTANRLTRARHREPKVVATLSYVMGGEISLRGEHGARVLAEVCNRWNAEARESPGTVTSCAADYQNEAGRRKYLTKS
ncbi:MAG: hypothetical protein ACO3GP_06850 [Candidatus Limnocylindrus sp.]